MRGMKAEVRTALALAAVAAACGGGGGEALVDVGAGVWGVGA